MNPFNEMLELLSDFIDDNQIEVDGQDLLNLAVAIDNRYNGYDENGEKILVQT